MGSQYALECTLVVSWGALVYMTVFVYFRHYFTSSAWNELSTINDKVAKATLLLNNNWLQNQVADLTMP